VARRTRIVLKSGVWLACLTPLALLADRAWGGDLGANPIEFVTRWLGIGTLRLLLVSLSMTPLRIVLGRAWPIALRRLLGLFAFAYAVLHFGVWLVLDHFFDWPTMAEDVVKRPFMTVGMAALLVMIPLAATSTAGMIKRMGATAWRRLHRLAYAAGVLAVLHFLWLAKVGRQAPYGYGAWLALVLGVRAWDTGRHVVARRRRRGAEAAARGREAEVPRGVAPTR
jgi:sulfoxide reductase heme-binding subunit YedZ